MTAVRSVLRAAPTRDTFAGMHVADATRERGSIKRCIDAPISREQIESVVSAAVLAPNPRLVAIVLNANPEIVKEDHAAAMMGIENPCGWTELESRSTALRLKMEHTTSV